MRAIILAVLVLLAGNLFADTEKTLPTLGEGFFSMSIDETCYQGVVYITYWKGLTVKFNRDGQIEKCHGKR